MAVLENDSSNTAAAGRSFENGDLKGSEANRVVDNGSGEETKTDRVTVNPNKSKDQTFYGLEPQSIQNFGDNNHKGAHFNGAVEKVNGKLENNQNGNGDVKEYEVVKSGRGVVENGSNGNRENGADYVRSEKNVEGFKKNMRDLEEMLSKLNPMAEEFVPNAYRHLHGNNFGYSNSFLIQQPNSGNGIGFPGRRKKSSYGQGKRRMNSRTSMAQREEVIRRTVYVADIDQQVTEENLALLFTNCGQVVDCRVCGDPNSVLRFAFIEFTDEEGARNALSLSGTMLGFYPVRVLPSKTAIAPVNPTFLPRSADEREMCARTVYCTNIDKKVTQTDVKIFFERLCGEVQRLRLLGDFHHSTRIAFVEFVLAESAIAALNCSGAFLGSLPIRVSPSKTPVRARAPR
ncbi:hypothetical protein Droror1_Dr00013048 [Drosera rotundifolia]